MHPPIPPALGEKNTKKTKEKKCVIYFVHVCTSKKTFKTKIVKEAGQQQQQQQQQQQKWQIFLY